MSEIREVVGNTTTTPNPQSDWAQTDETKVDYIKNKPIEHGDGENSIQQTNTGEAMGEYAISLQNSIAGSMGYRYKAIDFNAHKIYLTTEETKYIKLDNNQILDHEAMSKISVVNRDNYKSDIIVIGRGKEWSDYNITEADLVEMLTIPYSVGEFFTLKSRDYDYDKITKIASIEDNIITYELLKDADGNLTIDPFANVTEEIITKVDILPDRYSFSVPTQPLYGHVVITKHSFAVGSGAKAPGKYGIAIGAGVLAYGDGALAMGVDTEAGYQAVAMGQLARATRRNWAIGYNILNEGIQAFGTGASNTIGPEGWYSTVCGYQNKAMHRAVFMTGEANGFSKSDHQAIFGTHANIYADMALIVGNGTSDAMHNAFTVWKDGRATVGAAPQNDFDVATKKYVDTVNTEHPIQKGAGDYSVQMRNSTASGIGAVALTGSKVNGAYGFGIGYGTEVSATYAGAIGTQAKSRSQNSIAIGQGVQTASPNETSQNRSQIVLGRFNAILPGATNSNLSDGAVLIVGNGSGDNKRKNGLVVWADGRTTIGKAPENEMDVANKGYVDSSITSLVDSAPEALNTLGELADALNKHEDAYDALLETVGSKASTDYVDNSISGKLDKVTTAGHYRRVYAVDETGAQELIDVDREDTSQESNIPVRNESNNIYLPNAPVKDTDSANKAYVDNSVDNRVEKITTPDDYYRIYAVDETGSEDTVLLDCSHSSQAQSKEGNVPRRNENLCIYLPNEPIEETDSVNKGYVDGLIGDISTILTALHEGGIE